MSAEVDVITGDLDCEVGRGYGLQYIPHSTAAFLSSSASGCSLEVQPKQLTWDGYLGYMTDTTCINQTGEAAQRLLICTAHLRESPPETLPDGSTVWHQYATDNTTCLICKPTYKRMPAKVTISGNADIPSKVFLAESSESTPIPSLSAWALGYAAFRSMVYTTAILNPTSMFTDRSGFFQLVNYTSPQPEIWNLLDPHWLQEGSRKAFQLLTAQVAKSNILVPANETVTGTMATNEHRLCLQKVSFYTMETLFGVLILLTLALCLSQRKLFVPRDVGSLAGLATILAQSNDTVSTLRATGHLSDKQLENHLAAYAYRTTDSSQDSSGRFQIFGFPTNNAKENLASVTSIGGAVVTRWRPLALTPFGRLMTFLVPLILIITAQLLLQRSQNLNGIADIAPIAYIQYAWTLLPALVMLGVATLFDMFNAAARILQPYLTLKKGGVSAISCLFDDHAAEIALQSGWHAARRGHMALLASTIAILCGPLLTIIVSGLYKPGYVARSYPVEVYTTTWFNNTPDRTAVYYNVPDNSPNEHVLPSLIVYGNMSLPRWTTTDFALGRIKLSNTPDSQHALQHANGPVTLSTQLPAVQATLNCSTHPYQPINRTTRNTAAEDLVTELQTLYINVTVPPECSSPQVDGSFDLPVWNGHWQIPFYYYNGNISGAWVAFPNPAPPRCPTAAAIFGRPEEVPAKDELTVLLCTPYMEALQVNAIFSLPSFDLSSSPPPTPDPTTSRILSHDSVFLMLDSGATGGVFGEALVPVNLTHQDPRLGRLDAFFQALLEGSAPTDPLSLLGPQNSKALIDAMEALYRMVMAQLFNSQKQVPAVPGQQSILKATATAFDRQRLHQDPRSTYILEGLLAVMFLCAVVAMLAVDTKHVLPKNPYSVAAVASLLAGSEFLELIPSGAEWCKDSELRRRGVFEGYLFSMGWWGKAGSPERRFGIDIGKAERAE